MPSKNSIKQYLENGFYHVYNRGIDKRTIFTEELDHSMFLSYLKNMLIYPSDLQVRPVRKTNFYGKIELIAYCLMPNHFHFLIKQTTRTAMTEFMRSFSDAYTSYFNKRYKRIGPLFQGRYKAILIMEDPYLLHLTRYIHLNPLGLNINRSDLQSYPYSSYARYLGLNNTQWVKPEEILSFFKSAQRTKLTDLLSYQTFVEGFKVNSEEILGDLILE